MMLLIAFSDDSVTNPAVVITKKEKKHLNMTIISILESHYLPKNGA